ncbi:MAG: hypothetical protein LUD15_04495 [Bacteroides sp.]|nr:hypothetical protein [Bacteroides sp.]
MPGTVPLVAEPDRETELFFRRCGVLFRNMAPGCWSILCRMEESSQEVFSIRLLVKPQEDMFYYVTSRRLPVLSSGITVRYSSLPGVWGEIETELPVDPVRFSMGIDAERRYWEYIIFPGERKQNFVLALEERESRIFFTPPVWEEWIDGSRIYRSRSTEKIGLKQYYEYRVQLTENAGRRWILRDKLPSPSPRELSVTGASDTITAYIYL